MIKNRMEHKPINHFDFYKDFDKVEPVYSSLHIITSTDRDIHITFGQAMPPDEKATVKARIILNPQSAMELVLNLQKQLKAQRGEL